jgi:hypothetical protein
MAGSSRCDNCGLTIPDGWWHTCPTTGELMNRLEETEGLLANAERRAATAEARALAAEAALPSPAPVSEPTGEEVEAMAQAFRSRLISAGFADPGTWKMEIIARAAIALGARPPTKETT